MHYRAAANETHASTFGLSHLDCHLDLDGIPLWSKHPTAPNQRASVDNGQRVWCVGNKYRNIDT